MLCGNLAPGAVRNARMRLAAERLLSRCLGQIDVEEARPAVKPKDGIKRIQFLGTPQRNRRLNKWSLDRTGLQGAFHGLTIARSMPSKSETLRVATEAPRDRAIAAI